MSSRGKVLTPDGRVVDVSDKEWQYGRWWSKKIDQFNRELYSFRNPVPVEKGGELRERHFKRVFSALWPEDGPKPFVWHPWAEQMLSAACANQYLAVAGCASTRLPPWISHVEHGLARRFGGRGGVLPSRGPLPHAPWYSPRR